MRGFLAILSSCLIFGLVRATPLLWDGRARFNLTESDLDTSTGPFLTGVKGSQNASHYSKLLGLTHPPTPLWNELILLPTEQTISMTIDNTSVFVPGGGAPQYGFRRGEFIAQANGDHSTFDTLSEVGTTVYHFSIQLDESKPLNYNHEYQIVWIEPNDGTHVFGINLGSPFTNPTGKLPASNAHNLEVLDHATNVIFSTPFTAQTWHNFAVQVDWANLTLAAYYSSDVAPLKAVTPIVPNPTASLGAAGQGDFHFGVLKLPLVNPKDTPADQGDVVHYGIQEGDTEGLFYSGVFIEQITHGVSAGEGLIIKATSN